MSEIDEILQSETDRTMLQAADKSFWNAEYLNKATADLAALRARISAL
jgi:hypothetical protein